MSAAVGRRTSVHDLIIIFSEEVESGQSRAQMTDDVSSQVLIFSGESKHVGDIQSWQIDERSLRRPDHKCQ